jgi:protein-L-isoaspartate(D-aspartate) O-methyltransferase
MMNTWRPAWMCFQASIIVAAMAVAAAGAATLQPERTNGKAPAPRPWTPPQFEEKQQTRGQMVGKIRSYGLEDEKVLAAMSAVPRHEFVPPKLRPKAYADSPLPIGYGQTISQPYIVAEMTRLLKLDKDSSVLEVGTGSAYQAAVLAHFTPHVYSIEIIEPLATAAAARLQRLGYTVVTVRHADGYDGWPEKGPFDGIVVTAAAGEIPPPLIRQLKMGGRMVIPVGSVFGTQSLMLVEKDETGRVRTRSLMPVRFVPLTRQDRSKR